MVAADIEQNEGSLLRELVGDKEEMMEAEMNSGSELSEIESKVEELEEMAKGTGRPEFRCVAPGAGKKQSTQDFSQSGSDNNSGSDIFSTPGRLVMRGGLTRSHFRRRRVAHSGWGRCRP